VLYRVELVRQPPPAAGGRVLLEHPIDLAGGAGWLMRCDRVDFEPGGIAPPHRHRGGGIRCLLRGRLEVTVAEGAPRTVQPGEAWFESGREPVLAVSAAESETSFIRFSIQPAAIRGQSSILYVDPADAGRGRPRRYTVYVDEPIAL
jgi:quercetin dioxygenase-like cupin family protein